MRIHLYTMALVLCTMFHLTSCAQGTNHNNNDKDMSNKKVLVAFFSRAGENYSVGNVKTGNTQIVAQMIADATNANLFHIKPVKEYPADYSECTEVAKNERNANARPAYKGDAKVEDYDIIFLGYPNWWGDAPMAVYTFIEAHRWSGKTVIPFCTHEGSGLSNSSEIREACKGATVLKGLGVYGHTAQNNHAETQAAVEKWLKGLKL